MTGTEWWSELGWRTRIGYGGLGGSIHRAQRLNELVPPCQGTSARECVWREGGVRDDSRLSGLDGGEGVDSTHERGRAEWEEFEMSVPLSPMTEMLIWHEGRQGRFQPEAKGLGNLQEG